MELIFSGQDAHLKANKCLVIMQEVISAMKKNKGLKKRAGCSILGRWVQKGLSGGDI